MAAGTATRCDRSRDPAMKKRLQLHTQSKPEATKNRQLDVPLTSSTRSLSHPRKIFFLSCISKR